MPEGAALGIGEGIGQGLGDIATSLREKHARQRTDRDTAADKLEEQIRGISDNIAKVGGKDAPEAKGLIDQLNTTVKQHNSLFLPHEAPMLMQRIEKFFGHQPGAPKADPRAGMTAEASMAQAPVKANPVLEFLQQTRQAIKTANPELPDAEVGKQAMTALQQKYNFGPETDEWRAEGVPFKGADDKMYQRESNKKGELRQVEVTGMPAKPDIKKPAKLQSNSATGGLEAIEDPNTGNTYHADNIDTAPPEFKSLWESIQKQQKQTAETKAAAKTDTSPQGRMAKALLDSGDASTPEDATKAAAKQIVDAEKAKAKAASDTGGALTPEEAMSLARTDIILGRTTSFGLGKSPDRATYNRAKAELMMGGKLGSVLGEKADAGAIQNAVSSMTNMRASVGAFQKTLDANLDQVIEKSKSVGRSGASLANEYSQYLAGKLTDYPELQAFRVAVNTAANEYGRITNSATGGGVSTDSARGEALSLLNTALSQGALEAAVDQMRTDSQNRIKGMDSTLSGLHEQMGGVAPAPASNTIEELEFGPDGKLRKKP